MGAPQKRRTPQPYRVLQQSRFYDILLAYRQARSLQWVCIGNPFLEKEEVALMLKTQAATELARLLAHHPTPEQIVAFHPSSEVAERAYELIHTEREGTLAEEERQELESYLVIEYLMQQIKLEAHRQ